MDKPQIKGGAPRAELAPPSADREHLESLASAFLGAALTKLAEERVLPVSPYRPWIQAGIDYPGSVIHDLPETRALAEDTNGTFGATSSAATFATRARRGRGRSGTESWL